MLKLRYYFVLRKKTSNCPWTEKQRECFAAKRRVQPQEMEHLPTTEDHSWVPTYGLIWFADGFESEKYYQHNNSEELFKCYTYHMNTPIWEPSILLYVTRPHYFALLSTIPLLTILHFVYLWNTSWICGYFQLGAITNKPGWTLIYKVLYGLKFPLSLYFLNTHQWDGGLIAGLFTSHVKLYSK